MTILVTGSEGFIARNLIVRLRELNFNIQEFNRHSSYSEIEENINNIKFIYHLAGENRPESIDSFYLNNQLFTEKIVETVKGSERNIPIIFSSSTQVNEDNDYGKSKLKAEEALKKLQSACIYRLPGVFGKWSKPNYNSVVATFAYNAGRNLDLHISDKNFILNLVYIDDVVDSFINDYNSPPNKVEYPVISNNFEISLDKLASLMLKFKADYDSNQISNVGVGIERALFSTFLSFLDPEDFIRDIKANVDERGQFSEILKTDNSGQFSYFTAKPGITRGEHYHHTKNERF